MLYIRPGSQVWQLITLLSFVGEYPVRSLHLLGNERVYKALVHKLTTVQIYRLPQTDLTMETRLLTVTGKANGKTIRLYKSALPILDWIHPDAYRYYMDAFWSHRFPGDAAHWERNHRVAEAAAMFISAGVEAQPYLLPHLQNREILRTVPETPCFYLAKDIKKVGGVEMNKTMFTRMVGAFFCSSEAYAVYNTRDAVMKWSGKGEFKALHSLIEIGRLNAGLHTVTSAILFGESGSVALNTLVESDHTKRMEFRFDSIYRHIYFIPMNEYGIRQLKILSVPDWNEKLLDLLFEPDIRTYDKGLFEYDAFTEGVYVFSHLDSDLARLIRFREAIRHQTGRFEVLCFPHQMPLLREYLGRLVTLKTIDMVLVESELGPDRRSFFER